MNFGVFYTCYTEIQAVDHSLEVLRKLYPECPVYLVSDGGSSYDFLKKKMTNIEVFKEEDSRGFIPFLTPETFRNDENQNLIRESIKTFLSRVKRAIDYCKTDCMLVMEPDVLVRGKLTFPEGSHLLGSRINSGLSDNLREIVKRVPGSIDVNTWGATPAFFKCNSFLKAYELIMKEETLNSLCLSDHRLANYDVLFAVMFALAGYEETYNPEIVECFREPMWRVTKHPLVHQYREHYPKSTNGYDGFHTKHTHGLGDSVA